MHVKYLKEIYIDHSSLLYNYKYHNLQKKNVIKTQCVEFSNKLSSIFDMMM
jgi:hypothetical protein